MERSKERGVCRQGQGQGSFCGVANAVFNYFVVDGKCPVTKQLDHGLEEDGGSSPVRMGAGVVLEGEQLELMDEFIRGSKTSARWREIGEVDHVYAG